MLIGSLGLENIDTSFPFASAVEAGWRLASRYCGQGYATEVAKAVLHYGFDNLGFEEIVSYAVASNQGSQRVMEKIGMKYDPQGDFAHPELSKEHLYSKHVLYRIRKIKKGNF